MVWGRGFVDCVCVCSVGAGNVQCKVCVSMRYVWCKVCVEHERCVQVCVCVCVHAHSMCGV